MKFGFFKTRLDGEFDSLMGGTFVSYTGADCSAFSVFIKKLGKT